MKKHYETYVEDTDKLISVAGPVLDIGGQGRTEFCHMIFKNMALYMNKVFSKDDCIKAYNYLQTLKAK